MTTTHSFSSSKKGIYLDGFQESDRFDVELGGQPSYFLNNEDGDEAVYHIKPSQNKYESNILQPQKYTFYLDFLDKDDEIQYRENIKSHFYGPVHLILFCFAIALVLYRIDLKKDLSYYSDSLDIGLSSIFIVCIFQLFIFILANISALTLGRIRRGRIETCSRSVVRIIFFGEIESFICFFASVLGSMSVIIRTMHGKCKDNSGELQSHRCNPNAQVNGLPTDSVLFAYLAPLCIQIVLKGVRKRIILISWAIPAASVAWSVIELGSPRHIFVILLSFFFLLMAFENERHQMSVFLMSKHTLSSEMKKRKAAENARNKMDQTKAVLKAMQRDAVLKTLPLHHAIIYRADVETLLLAISTHIETAKKREMDGKTAFSLILEHPDADIRAVTQLLMNSLPVDRDTGLPVDPIIHDFAWTRAVQYERYSDAIIFVLSLYPFIANQLAAATDKEGRQAVNIASPKCKKAIMKYIYFFKRYEILTLNQPHYQTTTSIVHLAIDHDSTLENKNVALKFMRHRDQFLREINVRGVCGFDEKYVIGAIRVHDSAEDADFHEEVVAKGFQNFPYCFVMQVGERNLTDIMIKEHIAGRDWNQVISLVSQIASAVGHMHEKGFVHGDLKPLNIMRAAGEVKLIDLDASVSFTSGKNFTALKFSSGHVAPELVYCSDTLTCVRSASFSIASRMVNSVLNLNEEEEEEEEETQENATVSALAPENSSPNVRIRLGSMDYNLAPLYPEFVANLEGESKEGSLALSRYCSEMSSGDGNIIRSKREYDLVPAARAHDLWSLGVVIYELATNAPLFLVDGDGNIHKSDLKVLSEWKDSVKNERLERVQNVAARNLISLLLSKDPKKRPNIEQVLAHPFLTGRRVKRLVGDAAQFDVFLSYRVHSDLEHAEMVYKILTKAGLKVWWDKACLRAGEPWGIGFCEGLLKSKVFLPIFSKNGLHDMTRLTTNSPCDNLLLEFTLALELRERGFVEKIFPLFVGEKDLLSSSYCKYTFEGIDSCHPQSLPLIVVGSVKDKLDERLDELGLGVPLLEVKGVSQIIHVLLDYQGCFIEGVLPHAMDKMLKEVLLMLDSTTTQASYIGPFQKVVQRYSPVPKRKKFASFLMKEKPSLLDHSRLSSRW